MIIFHLEFDQEVPQYACSSCSNCHSIFGRSLCSVKNRGCCWYFPKFTLYEIHKMVKTKEGSKVLSSILKLPNVKIYSYHIHAIGRMDKVGYDRYLKNNKSEDINVKDKSIFFRTCPFVKPGIGCTLPKRYRSYVCNLFICSEVASVLSKNNLFNVYMNERQNYARWVQWENLSLEMMLRENKVNLESDFQNTINILKELPLESYEFPKLAQIEEHSGFNRSA
ncbi:hypothetical protein [Clostridium oryzae]|uniref:Uncharacterized protein n=1 Tax=Clostridium oryzae TaxID=1450648 RepID=A0A1V4IEM3_9CLOT|nr:hypothetical protein [Clostridium oryzae]OPJ58300.1 hypothetical protein CLORY_36630 [Clostridium oryzae]